MSEFSELLLMEFRKTRRRYLQVLVIYSCACNGGWSLDFLIGYRSLAIDVLGKNDAMWYGTFLCCFFLFCFFCHNYLCSTQI